ncbi:protein S100-A14-like [Brachionichthys hirsutus]|uniref:protein S100-A14-like n=1 Tax=Brachionichthys hirsutus TaxID=412623 RepID=UPI00360445C1
MATKYSDLELAINSLVTEFHQAAGNEPAMGPAQFQSMISNQLPRFAKSVDSEDGLSLVLQQMGVQKGDNISFESFWALINKEAIQVFSTVYKEKSVRCGCLLQ